ncbi:hypothetical protein GCM10009867_24660 [Pedococcus aerophilus]|uniref:DUF2530 domain-containing protein n=1 Tax=Pedococcus aerophilus TaxID=436356 RepID=A0ABP6H8G5_9MICO
MSESQHHPADADAPDSSRGTTGPLDGTGPDELRPLALSSATVTLWGTVGWLVALGIILAVPSLHEGERHWWPWTCVTAIVLGLLGFSYVRRGRGNAAGAE